jgi:hypothetical protein
MRVRAWRGAAQDSIVTELSEESCGYTFRPGMRYLIVASRRTDGRLVVSSCGSTQLLSEAAAALAHLRLLAAHTHAGAQAWGRVSMPARWVKWNPDYDPVPQARVIAHGPVTRSTITDTDGRYSFASLPDGNYSIHFEPPRSMPQLKKSPPRTVSLDRINGCASVDLHASIHSYIEGRVLDEDGVPLVHQFVELSPADWPDRSNGTPGLGISTDESGGYAFANLPQGRYVVAIDDGTYAKTATGEVDIVLPFGGQVRVQPIVARSFTPVRVQGSVLQPDGRPAGDTEVVATLVSEKGPVRREDLARSGSDGQFQLKLRRGMRFLITAGRLDNPDAIVEIVAGDEPIILTMRSR